MFRSTEIPSFKLYYQLSPDAQPRKPTKKEIKGVVDQTILFFSDFLRAKYENFSALTIQHAKCKAANTLDGPYFAVLSITFTVQFSCSSFFAPDLDELLDVLNSEADLDDYIEHFVWKAEPEDGSIFHSVQRVRSNFNVMPTCVVYGCTEFLFPVWLLQDT